MLKIFFFVTRVCKINAQCLLRERFVTQLCLQISLGGMPVLLASPLGDIILAQLACPLSDIMFRLFRNN